MHETQPTITVRNCQRCGEDHEVAFHPLTNPSDHFNFWAFCPVVRQPLMLSISHPQPKPRRSNAEIEAYIAALPGHTLEEGRAMYRGDRPVGARFSTVG